MKVCGIVAEYNPFHNGHAYQIEQIHRRIQPDVVVAVMSGNFLQRGEPALVDKWTRTKMALAGGVDLVVELPAVFSTQPADYFAQGALQILSALGIDALSFGVESGTKQDYLQGAQWLFENEDRLAQEITSAEAFNVPYARQMQEAIEKLAPDFPLHLNSPNNQLGFAYAKEIVRHHLEDAIELFPLKRKSAGYDDQEITPASNIASATAIRRAKLAGANVAPYIPEAAYTHFTAKSKQMVTWENYFPLLKYQLIVQSQKDLQKIYQMNEGLENRLKGMIQGASSFNELMGKIKTKRYTHTRLQRLLTYTLLQWTKSEVEIALDSPKAIRVLGFTDNGQEYLSQIKHTTKLPLLTNVKQEHTKELAFDLTAGEIYRLGNNNFIPKQDFTQKPIKN